MAEKKIGENGIFVINIIAILIRRRKVIIFSTLIGFIFEICYLFVYPFIRKDASESVVQVIYSGNIEKMSPELSSYINFNLPNLAEQEIKDYVNFAKIQKKYNVFTKEDDSEFKYNATIKSLIDENLFSVSVSSVNNSYKIKASVPERKLEDYKLFINDYIYYCADQLDSNISQVLDSAIKNIDELVENINSSDNSSSDLANLFSMRLAIKNFNDNHSQVITINSTPFITGVAKGRVNKLINFTCFILFASILVVFLLNTIENIKKDQEAFSIISDAWKAGK